MKISSTPKLVCLFAMTFLMYLFPVVPAHAETQSQTEAQGQAAKQKGKGFDLDQIVVTATNEEVISLDVPASVTILSSEDIEKAGYRSTSDLIGHLPGVTDQSIGESFYYDFRGTKSSDACRGPWYIPTLGPLGPR
jgi:outer membrane cobalamin receptor